jgi:hypothetical protein
VVLEKGQGVFVWDTEEKNTSIFFRLIRLLTRGIVIQKLLVAMVEQAQNSP